MATRPQNIGDEHQHDFSTAQNVIRRTMENYPYVAHLVGGTSLSTSGSTMYGAATTASTGISSGVTALKTALSSTISWPGLEGAYLDEVQFFLQAEGIATAVAATTIGYVWQAKNSTGSTWANLHAVKTYKCTSVWSSGVRTMGGYRLYRDSSITTGLNKLPINIRLRFFCKAANGKGQFRVSSSSYVSIKARKNVTI